MPILAKKKNHVFKQAKLSHAYIEKPTHPKRASVWCGFWSWGIIGPFLFENEQEEAVTVNSQKLKRSILATFGFNRKTLRATQPKLHTMFCALFLKIALSAAELMSFGHLGTAIWHSWTIICWVPCYADKPETIEALKDNIREAIGEIQLHTMGNVIKN